MRSYLTPAATQIRAEAGSPRFALVLRSCFVTLEIRRPAAQGWCFPKAR